MLNICTELSADDIDFFIDMIETPQQERENLKRTTNQVNEIAFTPPANKLKNKFVYRVN